MKRPPIREIVWLFILTRLLLMLVTYFSYVLLTAPKYSSTTVDSLALFTSWNHWDAENYVRIAQFGYRDKLDLAFFPLFPLLMSAIGHILGSWSYLLVGTLISNLALLGAMFVIYQLAADSGGDKVASRTLLYLCIFPTAFFFFAAYNESLFLFFVVSFFLALRRQRWWLAGVLGFLAALTRNAGALLAAPYLYELWLARESILSTRRKTILGLLPIALIPLGTLLYCLYCWQYSGDPLAFSTVQSHWARHISLPWIGIWQALFELFWNQPFGSFNQAHILLDLGATVSFIVLLIAGRHSLRMSYTIWTALMLLLVLLAPSTGQHDSLISNQRFVLELFPCFITLARFGIKHPRFHQALKLIFPALLATLSALFVMNRWMV
ncbi:hypothetical protein EPA93_20320 [Ktedonosporobacter rubrisoli]|uniref:Glycosyltransferase RgtA/B/C/D-like domain-containing protein n=1 Tax=Ktedonosporobacter rubrisoli TaxID=2509675 RepID=A0A4P6JRU8_KTERU|nr:mannosyltransferase family protein [Ktedonosporobacter rubrisoli]QBD78217.1 hypothetical protein EPA93_20320 [Ktedonosporobacter rubrisoli]